jgi:hypothetical protein
MRARRTDCERRRGACAEWLGAKVCKEKKNHNIKGKFVWRLAYTLKVTAQRVVLSQAESRNSQRSEQTGDATI